METGKAVDDALIDLAERLADSARTAIRQYFRKPLTACDKADATPVTAADHEAEQAMRALVEAAYPHHGFVGEEFGTFRADADYVWVVDPIDGTKQFITGKPTFGSLIALVHRGRPVIGIIEAPAQAERWIGAAGRPTVRVDADGNRRPVHTRPCARLTEAALYTTSPDMYSGAAQAAFERLKRTVKLPMFGGDCYNFALLASGFCDIVVEGDLKYFDHAALTPVVEGAGGVMTDWRGGPLTSESDGFVIAAGDRRLHDSALAILGS